MSRKLNELQRERLEIVTACRAMLDKAETHGRELTEVESNRYSELFDKAEALQGDIDREQKLRDLERDVATRASNVLDGKSRETGTVATGPRSSDEYRKAFGRYLKGAQMGPEDYRALQVDSDTAGGYLVAPQQFVEQLISSPGPTSHRRVRHGAL